ncbi:MAG: hypothetical protein D9C04_05085 [Nitrosopumilus sp. B06]|nr:MAG: hypothetical protein EB828_01905 [Nitrosopumilus sp. D6]RNJ79301.1 MAG: hypothetical protein D9C04_05085 [Nitrosopumilus sp. B06]
MTTLEISHSKRLLIIPDIHNKTTRAEEMIMMVEPDHTIFLGDYFDSFGDSYMEADDTARWLKKSLEKPDRTHLVGNHDLSYMTPNPYLKCSGYDGAKYKTIAEHCIDWKKLVLYCQINDDWLCTHAGLSKRFCDSFDGNIHDILESSARDLSTIHDSDAPHPFFQVGKLRGGTKSVGGILWCDYDEFEDIPGIRQIFGHTNSGDIRHVTNKDSEHYCIDTGMRHYALYHDGELRVLKTRSLTTKPC